MGKTRRQDKAPEQQRWERARDRIDDETGEEMYRRDTLRKEPFHLAEEFIQHITSPEVADRVAGSILFSIDKDKKDFNYIGFDVEGTSKPGYYNKSPETLQLYTVADGMKRATIYQLNKVAKNKRLPRDLEKLLALSNNVFIGKGVKKEIHDFFRDFGVSRDQEAFLFIDILTLLRTCDVFQRPYPEDSQQYAANGTFTTSEDVPDDIYPRIFFDAGIRMIVEYFLKFTIDKRNCHVHGPKADWSAPRGLSKSMQQYAADDVASVYDVLSAAADLLDASRADFIQASSQKDNFFLHKTNLLHRFNQPLSSDIPNSVSKLKERIRLHHQKKMADETRRAKARFDYKRERCDRWREENDMPAIYVENPFPTREDREDANAASLNAASANAATKDAQLPLEEIEGEREGMDVDEVVTVPRPPPARKVIKENSPIAVHASTPSDSSRSRHPAASPVRAPIQIKKLGDVGTSHAWNSDIKKLKKLSRTEIIAAMEVIIGGKKDMDLQIRKIIYILERIVNSDNVSMLSIIIDLIPYSHRHDFAHYVMFGKWVYPN